MDTDLLILNANQVLTLSGEGPRKGEDMRDVGAHRDYGLAIEDGIIVDVGPTDSIRSHYSGQVIDASGCVVMPGFVDPHTHAIWAGSREHEIEMKINGHSYLDILGMGGGILRTVRETRRATSDMILRETRSRLDKMLLHGTTSAEVKTGYDLTIEGEMRLLRLIRHLDDSHPITLIPTYLAAHAVPPEYSDPGQYIDDIIRSLPRAAAFARFCDVFCEDGVFSIEESRRLLESARSLMGVKIHADEIHDLGGARLAAELKATSADHLIASSDEDLRSMADAGVVGVLLPASSFTLMKDGYVDARRMIRLGVPLALATDLNPNCWVESMQIVIAMACFCMRMYPEEAIVAATLNAAHACGISDRAGTLDPGKWGDVIVLNVPDYRHIPYRFGVNHVRDVIKAGRIVVRNGAMT